MVQFSLILLCVIKVPFLFSFYRHSGMFGPPEICQLSSAWVIQRRTFRYSTTMEEWAEGLAGRPKSTPFPSIHPSTKPKSSVTIIINGITNGVMWVRQPAKSNMNMYVCAQRTHLFDMFAKVFSRRTSTVWDMMSNDWVRRNISVSVFITCTQLLLSN